jgi:hypothetical protein
MKMPMLYDLALTSREALAPIENKIFPALGVKKQN